MRIPEEDPKRRAGLRLDQNLVVAAPSGSFEGVKRPLRKGPAEPFDGFFVGKPRPVRGFRFSGVAAAIRPLERNGFPPRSGDVGPQGAPRREGEEGKEKGEAFHGG